MAEWAAIHKPIHWREGRSAHTVADFILHRNGAAHLESRLAETLGEEVAINAITPELQVKFDRFGGRGRMHDLGVSATAGRSSLFVGVEAKVDERFGDNVKKRYQSAKRALARNSSSNAVTRIEKLLTRFAPPLSLDSAGDLRYQLVHGTVGTIAAQQTDKRPYDGYVFYVLVFQTGLYDAPTGESNYADFQRFIQRVSGQELSPLAHRIIVDGRELTCIYESIGYPPAVPAAGSLP